MQKITSFLTFVDQAEAAINFYVSIFKNSKIVSVTRYGAEGALLTGSFELEGQPFIALNGGPSFTFSNGISLFVNCETQAEVDELWEKLSAGGEQQPCGWLKDKFGISWQIIPTALGELMNDPDPQKAQSVMQAMLQMSKIEIKKLQEAHAHS